MRTGAEILADMGKLRQEACEFLMENRAANEREGFMLVGPAAVAMGKEIEELSASYRSIVFPSEPG